MNAANDEGPTVAAATPPEQTKHDAPILADDGLQKQIATAAAELALRGFALHRLTSGGYCITRWDRTAHAPDLRSVRAFLDRVGGRA